jgi:thioredoxin-related protein
MESKIMIIWSILLLFLITLSIIQAIKTKNKEQNNKIIIKNKNTALNRIILLYNEHYIYYCKSMNKYLNSNKECKKCTTIFKYG